MQGINQNTIFIAGGGTGGHLFPAITIGNCLQKYGMNVIYIGSKHGIEKKYFIDKNLNAELLDIKGIQRSFSLNSIIKNLYFPIRFIKSYLKSRQLIKKLKPKIIIGTGGYSSGMPLLAGVHMDVPTMIQDQNSIPGLITKRLCKKVNLICTAYNNVVNILKTDNIVLTGNPLRENLKAIDKHKAKNILGLDINKKTIFILGGSQGSQIINNHVNKNIDYYDNDKYQLFLQCGNNNFDKISNKAHNSKNIIVKKFINDISTVYSAADIVVSRAGALAISELCYMGKAIILIPFKFAADNHQKLNANSIQSQNACITINESKLSIGELERTISDLLNNEKKIHDLERNAKRISIDNSTEKIVANIKYIINGKNIRKN